MTDARAERFKAFMIELRALEAEAQQEDISLWGTAVNGPAATTGNDLSNSPAFKSIVAILHQSPLLVAPTLKWLQVKMAEMARAQLNVLYTPEELQSMMESVQNSSK